ncbi:pentatricopeptide repeat-containing protein At5g16860 [Cryptomeria japonica]|uniref:pentatricopeptide repeat-containing protein At5g16860 n=1 Tax=Cryptomeria japonica TaxID=3369 RepID=UPI0027DA37F3|nr:pentatricopeptide repeat-containing protein At5g16860 [Cryptomeria japonica]XP_057841552.2 pentatricopeptide repeat-containing protein At5g16860 [Cryptomeria japonica]
MMRVFIRFLHNLTRLSSNITPILPSINTKTHLKNLPYQSKIKTLCDEWKLDEAIHVLDTMDRHGISADLHAYDLLLRACADIQSLEHGKKIHMHILNNNRIKQNAFLGNSLVNMYVVCGKFENPREVFDEIPERNVQFWNAVIREYVNYGRFDEAVSVFYKMTEVGALPNNYTFPLVLKACAGLGELEQGKDIHENIMRYGFESDIFVRNSLVNMYGRCGSMECARQIFDNILQRDVVSWNSMIAALAQNGYGNDALEMFRKMQVEEVKPDVVTFVSVLPACSLSAAVHEGLQVHGYVIKRGYELDISVGNAVMDMYAKCGKIADARQMFEKMTAKDVISWNVMVAGYAQNGNCGYAQDLLRQMQVEGIKLNVVTWSAMIAGYAQNGFGNEALELFHQMQLSGVEPNCVTFCALLSGCALLEALQEGKEIHNYIVRCGLRSNLLVGTALIDMYAKCKNIEDARHVFDRMSERNAVSWTVMIGGYALNGNATDALILFSQMQQLDIKPSSVTIACTLPACALLAAVRKAKEIHAYTLRSGFESVVIVVNSLIDVYAKCGNIDLARQVFDKITEKNVISWTAMIAGYGMHGLGKEALLVFDQMQQTSTKPDNVTYIAVLSACSHSGLVDEGWRHFDSLSRDHCLTPRAEHYACMADLLGRSGFLNEALEFIKKIPLEPSADVWGALLGACRTHHSVDIAESVVKHLFELEPENSGPYILLSNMYAEVGRWNDVAKVRKHMKDKGLKKRPGCSWIEVKNKVNIFYVADRSHPQTEKIYAMLESLAVQMRKAGYVPDTSFVLHDGVDEEKEH